MAVGSQRCSHKKTACGRCNSGICSACCKCPKLLGLQGRIVRNEPERPPGLHI